MFLGDFKQKQRINLGGAKGTTKDKNDLIRKAQQERENRERIRLELKSSIVIQKAFRNHSSNLKRKNILRKLWQDNLNVDYIELVQSFLEFYNPKYDMTRLQTLCSLLTENPPKFLRSFEIDSNRWLFLLGKLIMHCTNMISVTKNGFHLSFIAMISQLYVPPNINTDKISLSLALKIMDSGFLMQFQSFSGNKNDFRIFWNILKNSSISIALDSNAYQTFISQFTFLIFSIPHLSELLSKSEISPFILPCVHELAENETLNIDSLKSSNLLINMMHFINLSEVQLKIFIQATQKIILSLPESIFKYLEASTKELESSDEDMLEMDIEIEMPPYYEQVMKALSILISPSYLSPIVKSLEIKNINHTKNVSTLIISIISRWKCKKIEVLGSFLLSSNSVPVLNLLWDDVQITDLWTEIKKDSINCDHIVDEKFISDWHLLLLFVELFSRSLLTMTDDEFFGSSNPFSIEDIRKMSLIFKNLTFSLIWAANSISDISFQNVCSSFTDMKSSFARLLQQLHRRDSHKPFCGPDFWHLCSESELQSFTQIFLSADFTELHDPDNFRKSRVAASLQVLQSIPFVIPFETRIKMLRSFIREDRKGNNVDDQNYNAPIARVTIKRDSVFEDSYSQLNSLGSRLKGKIAITFVSEHGLVEAGIDGGGVFKEFLLSLSKQAFNANYGLFSSTSEQLLYPSPHSYATSNQQLSHFEFLGRIIGKALYEGVLIDVAFAEFFLAKWVGRQSFLDDLPSLDQELYQGLLFLKNYTGNVEKDLSLNFTVNESEFGESKTIELIPNGANIPVTEFNRIQYIYLCSNYKCQAFFRGLKDLIEPSWLRMFNQKELSVILGGVAVPINLEDLKRNIQYSGVYDNAHPTIVLFWKIVESFSEENRKKLVKFVTSCPRPPLLGFGELRPGFCIRSAGDDVERLPTASTCINLLKLPEYTDEETFEKYFTNLDF